MCLDKTRLHVYKCQLVTSISRLDLVFAASSLEELNEPPTPHAVCAQSIIIQMQTFTNSSKIVIL